MRTKVPQLQLHTSPVMVVGGCRKFPLLSPRTSSGNNPPPSKPSFSATSTSKPQITIVLPSRLCQHVGLVRWQSSRPHRTCHSRINNRASTMNGARPPASNVLQNSSSVFRSDVYPSQPPNGVIRNAPVLPPRPQGPGFGGYNSYMPYSNYSAGRCDVRLFCGVLSLRFV